MQSQTHESRYCTECYQRVLGFKKVLCPRCGALRPTAGYSGRTARERTQEAKASERSLIAVSAA
jgi:hypothetical protein